MDGTHETHVEVCGRFGAEPFPTPADLKVGIASNVRDGVQPLNGRSCHPEGDRSGWHIWAGEEWSDDPDFFAPCTSTTQAWILGNRLGIWFPGRGAMVGPAGPGALGPSAPRSRAPARRRR
jgi:hypothetical protein